MVMKMTGNWSDMFFGPGSTPIRREVQLRITVDADGNEVVVPVYGESVTASADDSIDRLKAFLDGFYHCGCDLKKPLGGRCGKPGCRRVECEAHFGHCAQCNMPLCLECSQFNEIAVGTRARFCHQCYGVMIRSHWTRRIVRGLLRPIVEFKDEKPQ